MKRIKQFIATALILLFSVIAKAQVTLSIPDTSSFVGDIVTVPLSISGLNGSAVEAFEMTLTYDAAVLSVQDSGYNKDNTLSSSFTYAVNDNQNGEISISAASATGFSTDGVMVHLTFHADDIGSGAINIQNIVLNEGSPVVSSVNNGLVQVSQMPDVSITLPDTSASVGEILKLPIEISGLDGQDVSAFKFKVTYDENYLTLNGNGFETSGSLSSGFSIASNSEVPGEFQVTGAAATGFNQDGEIIYLLFQTIQAGTTSVNFVESELNEGDPTLAEINGSVTISEVADYLDIVASSIIYDANNEEYQITLTNNGNITASGNFQIGVFLSNDNVANDQDSPFGIHVINESIQPNESKSFTFSPTESIDGLESGEYYLWFAVNLEGSTDIDIDNNVKMSKDLYSIVGTSTGPEGTIPSDFVLEQNYPNPFNPTTQISFQLPQAGNVNFRVFDMMGREVFSQLNEQRSAGEHTITFNASILSSGIYIYQVQSGSFSQTRKMTLIK